MERDKMEESGVTEQEDGKKGNKCDEDMSRGRGGEDETYC